MPHIPLHYIFLALAVITFAVLTDMKEAAKTVVPRKSDREFVTLRLHKFYLFLGISLSVLSVYLSVSLIKAVCAEKGEYWLEITITNAIAILLLLLVGTYYTMSYFNHRVVLKPNQLEITNWRGKKFIVLQKEISEFKEDFGRRKFKLYAQGRTIQVHQHLVGLATLKNWLKRPLAENE